MKNPLWDRAKKAFRGAGVAMLALIVSMFKTGIPDTPLGWAGWVSSVLGAGIVAWVTIFYAENAPEYKSANTPS